MLGGLQILSTSDTGAGGARDLQDLRHFMIQLIAWGKVVLPGKRR
jgi:hypothetical protein